MARNDRTLELNIMHVHHEIVLSRYEIIYGLTQDIITVASESNLEQKVHTSTRYRIVR